MPGGWPAIQKEKQRKQSVTPNNPTPNNPNDNSDLQTEYQAAHESCVLFDISNRDEIRLTGEDRSSFLHGFCTNDINQLKPGEGCEAFLSSIQGKTLGHIFVFAQPDRLTIDTNADAADFVIPHLDRYLISEDVVMENSTAERKLFYLSGPESLEILKKIAPAIEKIGINGNLQTETGSQAIDLRRVDWFHQPGFQISTRQEDADQLLKTLLDLGTIMGAHQTWETLRIESGFPEYGIDFNSENLAQEIDRTASAISFNKGCYLGQEPIARIDALGHVNRLLRRLEISTAIEPVESLTRENSICSGESEKSLGQITSAAIIPQNGDAPAKTVALATVRREIAEPGTRVTVKTESKNYPAVIR